MYINDILIELHKETEHSGKILEQNWHERDKNTIVATHNCGNYVSVYYIISLFWINNEVFVEYSTNSTTCIYIVK